MYFQTVKYGKSTVVTGLCTFGPANACAFVRRHSVGRQRMLQTDNRTHILSSSNARWGSLRLAPIMGYTLHYYEVCDTLQI